MYKKPKRISSTSYSLENYIDGYDVYDSLAVKLLTDPNLDRLCYTITKHNYRPDLIAQDIYGSTEFLGILLIQCGIGLENYVIGRELHVLTKKDVESIINSL